MDQTIDLIWNAITNSAKRKFDYSDFEKQFIEINENMADNILFQVIIGFASKKSSEVISSGLFNQMLMTGFIWKLEDIKDFVAGKDKLFSIEIYASQLANSLLDDGNEPAAVLNSITQLLN